MEATKVKALVTVIIPIYNRKEYLPQTLDSVINQTFTDWECLLIDDGSDKSTLSILGSYSCMDNRFRVLNNRSKKGANSCRNLGIKECMGKYCIFLDSDDILVSHCLDQRVKAMEENSALDFCVFPERIFYSMCRDSDIIINLPSEKKDIFRFMTISKDAPWMTSGPIWRVSSLRAASLRWDDRLDAYQDIDFHISALVNNLKYKFVYCNPDRYLRLHKGLSISKKLDSRKGCASLSLVAMKTLSMNDSYDGNKREYAQHSLRLAFYAIQACIRLKEKIFCQEILLTLQKNKYCCKIGKVGVSLYILVSNKLQIVPLARICRYLIHCMFAPWLRTPNGTFRIYTLNDLSKYFKSVN